MPRPIFAPSFVRAPRASAPATTDETAPCEWMSCGGTSARTVFASSEYTSMPPRKYTLEPECSLRIAPSSPPVHDSATATVSFFFRSAAWSARMRSARSAYAGGLAGTRARAALARLQTPPLGDASAGDRERRRPEVADPGQDREGDRGGEERVREVRERERRHREDEEQSGRRAGLEDRLHLARDARPHAVAAGRCD